MAIAAGQGTGEYCVDIVMCIDATGSMAPIINEVKNNALMFHQKFIDVMEEDGKEVAALRIKVIVFRDYICDSEPMVESPFYILPDKNAAFKSFISNIEACGGGDEPENALEAVALAIKSNWTTAGSKRRHVIVMFSDASALELGERKDCPNYPKDLPKTITELRNWWEGKDQYLKSTYQRAAGRFIAFVPTNKQPWNKMDNWERYWPVNSSAGTGLSEIDIQTVIKLITGSI